MKESEKVHFASKKARKKQGGVVIFLQSFCKEAVNDRLLRRKELFLQLFSVCRRSFPVKWQHFINAAILHSLRNGDYRFETAGRAGK